MVVGRKMLVNEQENKGKLCPWIVYPESLQFRRSDEIAR